MKNGAFKNDTEANIQPTARCEAPFLISRAEKGVKNEILKAQQQISFDFKGQTGLKMHYNGVNDQGNLNEIK